MDYEKKYKEAFERARALRNEAIEKEYVVDYIKDYETIFPELRESEDERIYSLIYSSIKNERPIASPKNKKLALAYLEKQKENPKSADSIPSKCVSDAKCENRWHKVADSLPDNGRLVLAQDCLGNTLLARYDGEGNWEVSVYDNNDYYCRNTITKWCEIPSEEQKEPHYTKRNALFDKCVENCDPEVIKEVSDKVDEMLGKEQKSADLPPGFYFIDLDGKRYYSKEFRYGDMKMKVVEKEQNPAEWSEEDKKMLKLIISELEDEGKDVNVPELYRVEINWLKSICPSWKPSEEQLTALDNARHTRGNHSLLDSLYNDLKKLM